MAGISTTAGGIININCGTAGAAGGGIAIPQPQVEFFVSTGGGLGDGIDPNPPTGFSGNGIPTNAISNLRAFYRPTDSEFTLHNPEYWLFRYSRQRKQTRDDSLLPVPGDSYQRPTGKRYSHPVNNGGAVGASSALYGGSSVLDVKTEFPLSAPLEPYHRTPLDFDVYKFYKVVTGPGDFPVSILLPTGTRGTGLTNRSRRVFFKLAIVIDNPDGATNVKFPKLIGPFSETFISFPQWSNSNGGQVDGLTWKHEAYSAK